MGEDKDVDESKMQDGKDIQADKRQPLLNKAVKRTKSQRV